jgi:hypothetical protein
VLLEGLGQLEKINHLIGSQTRDIPACRKLIRSERNEVKKLLKSHE